MLALFSCPKEVSITPYLSKDQIAAAREMDLLTYLRRFEPEELVHIGGDTYATRTHDSLKISNGKWCWWSRNIGGTTALDYLTTVEGVSFLDAVQRILGELPRVPTKSEPTAPLPKTEFSLPPKHADTRRVFAYLRSRGIDAEIINHCIKHGQLYEDAERHNCVFVGYEHGNPAYGVLRGTLSETTFAGEVSGSDKRFSFAVPLCAGGKTLCVFESAIDALSYLTLLKLRGQDWRAANTLSLSGIYQPRKDGSIRFPAALEQYLKDNPGVARIVLCLDNVAIAGHNRGVNNHFGKIHTLDIGDTIKLTTQLGTRSYEVYSVSKIGVDDTSVLNDSTENIITLVTCVKNQPDYRWCVQARVK